MDVVQNPDIQRTQLPLHRDFLLFPKNVKTVVNICDKLLRQMIKESNIMQEKNVIQKLQTGVISVLNRKGITAFHNFHHSDDPGIVQKHSLIIVKKIVNLHSSIRLKFHCKNLYFAYFKVFE